MDKNPWIPWSINWLRISYLVTYCNVCVCVFQTLSDPASRTTADADSQDEVFGKSFIFWCFPFLFLCTFWDVLLRWPWLWRCGIMNPHSSESRQRVCQASSTPLWEQRTHALFTMMKDPLRCYFPWALKSKTRCDSLSVSRYTVVATAEIVIDRQIDMEI